MKKDKISNLKIAFTGNQDNATQLKLNF